VIHRAYRSLNEPVRLLGFTAAQWLMLVVTGAAAIAGTQLVGLPARPAITICSLVVTTVAATAYASEPGGVRPVGLLADTMRMVCRSRLYAPGIAPSTGRATLGIVVTGPRDEGRAAPTVDRAEEVFVA
jgi:hypothetical protein